MKVTIFGATGKTGLSRSSVGVACGCDISGVERDGRPPRLKGAKMNLVA